METATPTVKEPNSLFDQASSLEVITFDVSDTQYATPVAAVRYIEQDKRKTTRIEVNDKLGAEVTTYQGKPVPIYDFADLMGCEAEYKANVKLLKTLKDREKDHIDWMDALEYSIRNGAAFTLPRDATQCEFGKWYASYDADDELLADILRDFDEPHQRIHSLADSLLDLCEQDQKEKAISILEIEKTRTLSKLQNLFAAAKDRLENITRPILLYIDTDKKMIAVRLNAISDIRTFERSTFTAQSDVDDNTNLEDLNFIAGYLESEGDAPPCVLLDWHAFEIPSSQK